MKTVPSYGKILALGSALTENALNGEVVIQEKIDGSLFGFGINYEGEIVMRSKGKEIFPDAPDKMFARAVEHVLSKKHILKTFSPNTFFYTEYLQKPKHNTLHYERIPQNNLVLFDCIEQGIWVDRKKLMRYAGMFEIDVIPEMYYGRTTVGTIKELLHTESYLGREIAEGLVIKNYNQMILLGGKVNPLFTKLVREEFKERHALEWKIKTGKGRLEEFIESFKSVARWQKAIIHAKEKDLLTHSPKDIGTLVQLIKQDVQEEETENIKRFFYNNYIDDILRVSVKNFPEWYKNKLLEPIP